MTRADGFRAYALIAFALAAGAALNWQIIAEVWGRQ